MIILSNLVLMKLKSASSLSDIWRACFSVTGEVGQNDLFVPFALGAKSRASHVLTSQPSEPSLERTMIAQSL